MNPNELFSNDLSPAEWKLLLDEPEDWCLSLYMPTDRRSPGVRANPVRFDDVLRRARQHLAEEGCREEEAESLLAPVVRAAADPEFWREPKETLALFCRPGWWRAFRLSVALPEAVVAGRRFYVKPLPVWQQAVGKFFILAVSLNEVRFLVAGRDEVRPLELPGLPANLDEALGYEEYESAIQVHSGGPARLGRGGIYHGHGDDDAERVKTNVRTFLRQIARAVEGYLEGRAEPLILASVKEYFPLYAEENRYPGLLREGLAGNPEVLELPELLERAWPLYEAHRQRQVEENRRRYAELEGGHRVSSELSGILRAAREGQVEVLFTTPQREVWGVFEESTGKLETHVQRQPGDEDLLDTATFHTLRHHGQVFSVDAAAVPRKLEAAAILRYAV